MSSPGDADYLLVRARSALLDALDALVTHLDSLVVIGAQAIYLHTAGVAVGVAEATKDSDLAIDPRALKNDPLIEKAMKRAGFYLDPGKNQPGAWLNLDGIPVDLMIPEALAGGGGKQARGARVSPHDNRTMRRAQGLEAAIVDNDLMVVSALDASDPRRHEVRVAGTAALVVAKLHKLGDRTKGKPDRLVDKDAHDVYRMLVYTRTPALAADFHQLLSDELAGEVTARAVEWLRELFAAGPDAVGSLMAGRTEEGVGEPETVALQTAILASDLLDAIGGSDVIAVISKEGGASRPEPRRSG